MIQVTPKTHIIVIISDCPDGDLKRIKDYINDNKRKVAEVIDQNSVLTFQTKNKNKYYIERQESTCVNIPAVMVSQIGRESQVFFMEREDSLE